jgi:hypothetical protein
LSWKRRFDDPIMLPSGRKLVTLDCSARYVVNPHLLVPLFLMTLKPARASNRLPWMQSVVLKRRAAVA